MDRRVAESARIFGSKSVTDQDIDEHRHGRIAHRDDLASFVRRHAFSTAQAVEQLISVHGQRYVGALTPIRGKRDPSLVSTSDEASSEADGHGSRPLQVAQRRRRKAPRTLSVLGAHLGGADGTRTRGLRRDRPAL